jgi:hypothetical protein
MIHDATRAFEIWMRHAESAVVSYLWNGIGTRPGHVSIFSKYFTGTTPSKPSVRITLLSEM